MTVAWVVGARGLLGSAVLREVHSRPQWRAIHAEPLPWGADGFDSAVDVAVTELIDTAVEAGDDWAVIWAAGAAVTNSTVEQLEVEIGQLERVLRRLVERATAAGNLSRGSVFYASSAGGVYGGATHPPFTESTEPRPLGLYGTYKLKAEELVRGASPGSIRTFAGRISNLYGPGQRLDKMQGLISHLAVAQFGPRPASIYVPLDTVRDYLFVTDAAAMVVDGLERLRDEPAGTDVVKILASGSGTSIASLLGYFRTLSKNHPHVMLGASPAANLQGRDLRLISTVWTEIDKREFMPLPAGIRATMDDILRRMQVATTSS
jgi:UDP-glucose 4-epimerase